jgi:hypothetical protein
MNTGPGSCSFAATLELLHSVEEAFEAAHNSDRSSGCATSDSDCDSDGEISECSETEDIVAGCSQPHQVRGRVLPNLHLCEWLNGLRPSAGVARESAEHT